MEESTLSVLQEIFLAPAFADFVDQYMRDVFVETVLSEPRPISPTELLEPLKVGQLELPLPEAPPAATININKKSPDFHLTRTKRKNKLVWTKELHRMFLEAVEELGDRGIVQLLRVVQSQTKTESVRNSKTKGHSGQNEDKGTHRKERVEPLTKVPQENGW